MMRTTLPPRGHYCKDPRNAVTHIRANYGVFPTDSTSMEAREAGPWRNETHHIPTMKTHQDANRIRRKCKKNNTRVFLPPPIQPHPALAERPTRHAIPLPPPTNRPTEQQQLTATPEDDQEHPRYQVAHIPAAAGSNDTAASPNDDIPINRITPGTFQPNPADAAAKSTGRIATWRRRHCANGARQIITTRNISRRGRSKLAPRHTK